MYKHPVAGDVVYLKSGGLEMIVSELEGAFAHCVWHDTHGTAQSARYRLTLLGLDRPIKSTRAPRKKATTRQPGISPLAN
jgi:uncharacterized protein YodC (DUF2158 family)